VFMRERYLKLGRARRLCQRLTVVLSFDSVQSELSSASLNRVNMLNRSQASRTVISHVSSSFP
jgi:hypothetical protein